MNAESFKWFAAAAVLVGVGLLVRVGLGRAQAWRDFDRPAQQELKERLDPLQYKVTQENGTERAFDNTYWDNHAAGIYVDIVSGEPLFSSRDKFDSGTGWPSFTRPLVPEQVEEVEDRSFGMRRVEVRSKNADSHLGHLFDDGPAPTGLRYCINSAALRFIPVADLEKEGYGEFLASFEDRRAQTAISAMAGRDATARTMTGKDATGRPMAANASAPDMEAVKEPSGRTETATLAGGCFWGMEDILRDIPGVIDTEVGYTGGHVENPSYKTVSSGKSGHAEAVQVVFDPTRISYEEILGFFFRMHDPTTKNRQGHDVGSQYRSAIFYHDETQRAVAERVKTRVDESGKWDHPVVTEIVPAGPFYPAEESHQDYLEKHPNGYTCHYLRD